ncbi:hypothetical protein SELMODRAFT_75490 [Selaginella moellendorffii]|uniref:Uncharacterized protein n=1 Tax=Selaginella moellendorffii TaxID=88036 RepID=D8QPD1_SELML|nr:protein EXORDIUM-like 2 [Selaginella moellendorffii]EFJ38260.1 hypothetical protein SELMODRAFT_75490 [Selaginella moellendorffii]|eukprot:XP_002960721.1 protein EXORDIUM-like 2 [Selaginella moellendorffii]
MKISSSLLCLLLILASLLLSEARLVGFHDLKRALVPETPLVLDYHGGPLLAGKGSLDIYLVWYGSFTPAQKSIVRDFFASFDAKAANVAPTLPSVSKWWEVTARYKDGNGTHVFEAIKVVKEIQDDYSMGKKLDRNGTQELILRNVFSGRFPMDTDSFYLVLTAKDVAEHGFCQQSCGYHRHTNETLEPAKDPTMPYGWVGDSTVQCSGRCAWPFAHPRDFFGPDKEPLLPPNGDVGMDGLLINVATVLIGAATNPYGTGYYQGHHHAHLGAATACAGIYGKGAFPGHPGELLVDSKSGASYNAYGINGRKFLLPAVWDPDTKKCAYPAPTPI